MNINLEEKNGISIIKLIGRMDAVTVKSFEEACGNLINEGISKIIVDLSDLEYISSAGLRGILIVEKSSRAKKSIVAFCSMQSMVSEVFKISGFISILKVFASQEEALTDLA